MRALEIVIRSPCRKLASGLSETEEQCLVQKLITHATVEAFDEPVLHRLTGGDKVPFDLVVPAPGEHGVAGKLSSIVTDNHAWLATPLNHRCQLTCYAPARFICPSSSGPDSNSTWRKYAVAGQVFE